MGDSAELELALDKLVEGIEADINTLDAKAAGGSRRRVRGGANEWNDVKASAVKLATSLTTLVVEGMRSNVLKVAGVFVLALLNGQETGKVLQAASSVGGRLVSIATNANYVSMAIIAAFVYGGATQAGLKVPTVEEADAYLASFIKTPRETQLAQLKTKLRNNQRAARAVADAFIGLKKKLDTQNQTINDMITARDRRALARDEVRKIADKEAAAAAAAAQEVAAAVNLAAAAPAAPPEASVLGKRAPPDGAEADRLPPRGPGAMAPYSPGLPGDRLNDAESGNTAAAALMRLAKQGGGGRHTRRRRHRRRLSAPTRKAPSSSRRSRPTGRRRG